MIKWEYKRGVYDDTLKFISLDGICDKAHEITLDELGRKGWELIIVDKGWIVFKRPIPLELELND